MLIQILLASLLLIDSQLIPAQLHLTPQENTSDYIITWTPDWSNSTHYIVTVTPNSPDETTETITSTASATLSLNKTVTYNITVSFMECPDLYNMTFIPSKLQVRKIGNEDDIFI